MQTLKPCFQKKGSPWTDEANITIPFNRVSKAEQVKETQSQKILATANKASDALKTLLELVSQSNDEVSKTLAAETAKAGKEPKVSKGNFTWFNFDRTVKIEVNINEMIKFDEARIAKARELFDKFIAKNTTGTDDIVRQIINSAFGNTRGGLDTKKVLSLLKFRSKVRDQQFHAALDHIEASISRPSSKRYFRIWVKAETGEYQNIELNFSSL